MQEEAAGKIFVGELALDGSIRQVAGVLPMILYAREHGWREIYIPQGNAAEGELVDGIDVYTPASLSELVSHLKKQERLTPLPKIQFGTETAAAAMLTLPKCAASRLLSAHWKLPRQAGIMY